MISLNVPGLMCDSFYNSLNMNGEGMASWGAGAQWLWGQWGQSLPRRGQWQQARHSGTLWVLCLFLWISQCLFLVISQWLVWPPPSIFSSSCLSRCTEQPTSSHWLGHFPLCQRARPGVLLKSPQRRHSCFHTCSALCQACAIRNTWFPKCFSWNVL